MGQGNGGRSLPGPGELDDLCSGTGKSYWQLLYLAVSYTHLDVYKRQFQIHIHGVSIGTVLRRGAILETHRA